MPGEIMTTKKTNTASADEAPATPVSANEQATAGGGVRPVFRDRVYTSRTLVLSDGTAVPVAAGKIVATTDELLAYLTAEADFEPLPR
jgi:hypothetical protein